MHLSLPDELYESFRKYVVQVFYQEYLNPLSRDIEDYLRLHIHAILIEKITEVSPFKQDVKDIKRMLDVDKI
jgi:WASH complex subunit 7